VIPGVEIEDHEDLVGAPREESSKELFDDTGGVEDVPRRQVLGETAMQDLERAGQCLPGWRVGLAGELDDAAPRSAAAFPDVLGLRAEEALEQCGIREGSRRRVEGQQGRLLGKCGEPSLRGEELPTGLNMNLRSDPEPEGRSGFRG